jgi:hypothetical protein
MLQGTATHFRINSFWFSPPMAEKLHSTPVVAAKARPGCDLTISYGCTAVMPVEAKRKKKHSLLPVLTFLFVVSYGLMTVLIVEQGSAIQSQHNLIQVLMRDSTELWAAKGKAIGDQRAAHAQPPAGKESVPQAQAPSNAPSGQVPLTKAPKHHAQNPAGKAVKPRIEVPPAPASDLVDRRRSLSTI